jgi:hypothetical protein
MTGAVDQLPRPAILGDCGVDFGYVLATRVTDCLRFGPFFRLLPSDER